MRSLNRAGNKKYSSHLPFDRDSRASSSSISHVCPPRQKVLLSEKNSGAHIVYCAVPIREKNGIARVIAAVKEFINSQTILRSVFAVNSSGAVLMREYKTVPGDILILDLSGVPAGEIPQQLAKSIKDGFKPFSVFNHSLYRPLILRVAKDGYLLLWFISHLITNDCSLFYSLGKSLDFSSGVGGIARRPLYPLVTYRTYLSERKDEWRDLSKTKKGHILSVFKKYSKASEQFFGHIGVRTGKIQSICFAAILPANILRSRNLETIVSGVIAKYLLVTYNVPEIPLALIYHGRDFGKSNFANLIGDFCDVVPLVVRKQWVNTGSLYKKIDRELKMMRYKRLNITNVFVRMGLTIEESLSPFSKQDAPIIVNFIPYFSNKKLGPPSGALTDIAKIASKLCAAQKKTSVKNLSFRITCNMADGKTSVSLKYNDSISSDFSNMQAYFQNEIARISSEEIDFA